MLSVIFAECCLCGVRIFYWHTQYHYAECHHAESFLMSVIFDECHSWWVSFMLSAIFVEFCSCRVWIFICIPGVMPSCWVSILMSVFHDEWHSCWVSFLLSFIYTECWFFTGMLSVIMLNAIILCVMAPTDELWKNFSDEKKINLVNGLVLCVQNQQFICNFYLPTFNFTLVQE